MNCCIAWHTSEGFAVQLLERITDITFDHDTLNSTCTNWKSYVVSQDTARYDSGV
jgi:hypothetical protein